jgi:hypothetical protein
MVLKGLPGTMIKFRIVYITLWFSLGMDGGWTMLHHEGGSLSLPGRKGYDDVRERTLG